MNAPIILTAFGTASSASATYNHIEEELNNHFPGREIIWTYSSGVIGKKIQEQNGISVQRPREVLQELARQGRSSVILQSLHLLPGKDFHRLQQEIRQTSVNCAVGMPLLSAPADYQAIAELMAPLIDGRPEGAVLLIGHGTDHPVWTGYLALQHIFRQRFGPRIFVAVTEKQPPSEEVVTEIINGGYRQVFVLPFFLVAGMHYRRDIVGKEDHSWRNRLKHHGLQVDVHDQGVGLLPGIGRLIARHIVKADQACAV